MAGTVAVSVMLLKTSRTEITASPEPNLNLLFFPFPKKVEGRRGKAYCFLPLMKTDFALIFINSWRRDIHCTTHACWGHLSAALSTALTEDHHELVATRRRRRPFPGDREFKAGRTVSRSKAEEMECNDRVFPKTTLLSLLLHSRFQRPSLWLQKAERAAVDADPSGVP